MRSICLAVMLTSAAVSSASAQDTGKTNAVRPAVDEKALEKLAEAAASEAVKKLRDIERTFTAGNVYTDSELAEMDRVVAEAFNRDRTKKQETASRVGRLVDTFKHANRERMAAAELAKSTASADDFRKESGKLSMYFSQYMVAQYCAGNGSSFTAQEVHNVRAEVKRIVDGATFTQAQKDKVWSVTDVQFNNLKSSLSAEACAGERRRMSDTLPGAFVSGTGAKNPF